LNDEQLRHGTWKDPNVT